MTTTQTCPTCGHSRPVHDGDEGTSGFVPPEPQYEYGIMAGDEEQPAHAPFNLAMGRYYLRHLAAVNPGEDYTLVRRELLGTWETVENEETTDD